MAGKPTNHGKQWTKADESALRRQANADKPTTSIAKGLKRTQVAIEAKAQELGVSLRRPN